MLLQSTAGITYVEFSSGGSHHLRHARRTRQRESRQALTLRADLNGFVYSIFPGGKDKQPVIGAEARLVRTDPAHVENVLPVDGQFHAVIGETITPAALEEEDRLSIVELPVKDFAVAPLWVDDLAVDDQGIVGNEHPLALPFGQSARHPDFGIRQGRGIGKNRLAVYPDKRTPATVCVVFLQRYELIADEHGICPVMLLTVIRSDAAL